MDIIYKPIALLLKFCYSFTFNYALALLVFALIVKIILLPLSIKQYKNSLKQASLKPRETAIMNIYRGRNDRAGREKRQMEIQQLYKSEGYNQLAGCLPLLIQLPIILLIYNVIRQPLTYLCSREAGVVAKIKEVAGSADEIAVLTDIKANFAKYSGVEGVGEDLLGRLPNFSVFGIDLAQTPKLGVNILIIIPLLTFCFVFLSTKLMKKFSYQSPQTQMAGEDVKISMGIMDFMLPAFSTFITFGVPAVIGVYWIYQNLLGVLQQFIFTRVKPFPVFTEEDYKEAERLIRGKKKKRPEKMFKDPDRPRVRSLHHIDDEEYNAKVVDKEPDNDKTKVQDSLIKPVAMKDYPRDKTEKK